MERPLKLQILQGITRVLVFKWAKSQKYGKLIGSNRKLSLFRRKK